MEKAASLIKLNEEGRSSFDDDGIEDRGNGDEGWRW